MAVLRIRDVYPRFWISESLFFSKSDPGSNNNIKGGKICCLAFFVAINFTNLKIIYNLTGTEKNFIQLIREKKHFFTQKAVANLSDIWDEGNRAGIHDRESEIRGPRSRHPKIT
jgi:hypothetical protein